MSKAPRLEVREVSSVRHWLWVIGATIFFASASYGLYVFLRSQLPYDWEQVEVERERMAAQRNELNREISRLRDVNARQAKAIVTLERGMDIDHEATAELSTTIRDLQAELEAQREQLAFYRGIVSPDETQAGLRVYELVVRRTAAEAQRVGFDLMLIQAVRHNRRVSGRVSLTVEGVQDGSMRVLDADKLDISAGNGLNYAFRYFQEIRGSFVLPEGFAPTGVTVRVSSSAGEEGDFEKHFAWSDIIDSSGVSDVGQEQGSR